MVEETELVRGVAPLPDASGGVVGFVTSLRALKIYAGNPSLKELAKRSGVPRSTLADALNPDRSGVPRLAVVTGLVEACGVTPQEVLGWRQAWRAVQSSEDRRRINRFDDGATVSGTDSEAVAGTDFDRLGMRRDAHVGVGESAGPVAELALVVADVRDALRTLMRALDLPDAL